MQNAGYVFLACLFIVLAIVVRLRWRYNVAWITKNLQLLDLRVLGEVANGKRFGVGRDRLMRLSKRGYVISDSWGGCRITLKGRYAAFLLRSRAVPARRAGPSEGSPV